MIPRLVDLIDGWVYRARRRAYPTGFQIVASDAELEELGILVCLDGLTFEQVRHWFHERARRTAG